MARQEKSTGTRQFLILVILLIVPLTGCTSQLANLFNPDALQLLGVDPGITVKSEGSVIVVVQNLTKAACHDEYAEVTIDYSGTNSSGNVRISKLLAVPEQDRPANASYRKTVALSCGDVNTVSIKATIHRRQVTEEKLQELFQGGDESVLLAKENGPLETLQITPGTFVQATGNVAVTTSDVTKVDPDKEEKVIAVSTFNGFVRDVHFECGGVLVFAIMDEVNPDGSTKIQDRTSEYTFITDVSNQTLTRAANVDVAVFLKDLSAAKQEEAKNVLAKFAEQGQGALTPTELTTLNDLKAQDVFRSGYFEDPTQNLLDLLFPYPQRYMVIGVSLPTISVVDQAGTLLLDAAIQATGGLDNQQ